MIERIIPHPQEESFALFERLVASDSSAPPTRVLTFRPSSAMPTASRTLPFHLLSVVSQSSPTGPSSEHPSFTFIGITDSWSAVIFGDNARLPEEDGASARDLTDNVVSNRKTLLQDIFGKSAFVDLTVESAPSTAPVAVPSKITDASQIFDAPAHLIPPLETLFDDVMRGFLAERPADQPDESNGQDEAQDEDVDMDPLAADDLVVVKAPTTRIVDQQEMNAFVELFRHYSIKCTSISSNT